MSIVHLLKLKYPIATACIVGLAITSCGSYQQVSYYDNDGIYNSGSVMAMTTHESAPARSQIQNNQNDFYQDYFGERAQELDQVLEGEIFTDIDSYSSMDSVAVSKDSLLGNPANYLAYENDYQQNPAWGDQGGNVTVNVYGSNFGAGWYDPWLFNGWGYNTWNRPWGWGSFGWNGWGWGYGGFNNPWQFNSWYGYGYSPYYGNYFGHPYGNWGYSNFGYRNYAYGYSQGRRGYTNNQQNPRGSRYASATTNSSYRLNSGRSNATNNARLSSVRSSQYRSNTDAAARNETYRSLRSSRSSSAYSRGAQNYRNQISNTRTQAAPTGGYQVRSSGSSISRNTNSSYRKSSNTGRTSGNNYRSSGNSSRSSSGSYRSSGSSSRSSGGSVRSSGGSSRSSGGSVRSSGSGGGSRSSGSRSGGGRGN